MNRSLLVYLSYLSSFVPRKISSNDKSQTIDAHASDSRQTGDIGGLLLSIKSELADLEHERVATHATLSARLDLLDATFSARFDKLDATLNLTLTIKIQRFIYLFSLIFLRNIWIGVLFKRIIPYQRWKPQFPTTRASHEARKFSFVFFGVTPETIFPSLTMSAWNPRYLFF